MRTDRYRRTLAAAGALSALLIASVKQVWQWRTPILGAFVATWWITLLYVVALLALVFTVPGQDLIQATFDSQSLPFFYFHMSLVFGALQAHLLAGWIIARRLLSLGRTPSEGEVFASHFVPIAIVTLLLGAWPAFLPDAPESQFLRILLVMSIAIPVTGVYTFAGAIDRPIELLAPALIGVGAVALIPAAAVRVFLLLSLADLVLVILTKREGGLQVANWRKAWLVGGLLCGSIALYFLTSPFVVGLGAAVVLILAVQVWVVALGAAVTTLGRWAVPALIAVAAIIYLGAPQDRAVRLLPGDLTDSASMERKSYARRWLEDRKGQLKNGRYPVFIVAADGGGIRAAYWSASILTGLSDQSNLHSKHFFDQHVFALSGVSGGALGITVYRGLQHEKSFNRCSAALPCARSVLGFDALAPALANMLTREIAGSALQGFLPIEDRATALEKAVEQRWHEVTGNDYFSEALTDPALFLNATSDMSGERVVIQAGEFPRSLRASTAALLSARFPVISPGGIIGGDRLVDGGFADNSGAATAVELLETLLGEAEAMGLREKLSPIGIIVGNDDPTPKNSCEAPAAEPVVSLPVFGLFPTMNRVRIANAKRYLDEFKRSIARANGEVLHSLSLYRCGAIQVPLTWSLSAAARNYMDSRLETLMTGPDFVRIMTLARHTAASEKDSKARPGE